MSKYSILARIYIIAQVWMAASCSLCDPNCDTCSVICLSCKPRFYFSENNCYSCPQNCAACSSVDQCLSCSEGNYLLQEICYLCPNGFCKSSVNSTLNFQINDISKQRHNFTIKSSSSDTGQLIDNVDSQISDITKIINITHSNSSSDNANNEMVIKVSLIAVGIFVKLSVIVLAIYCCCRRCYRKRVQNQRHDSQRLGNPQEINATQIEIENRENWQRIPQMGNVRNQVCGICQDTQQEQELNVKINCKTIDCQNTFHYKCLDQWNRRKRDSKCPNCKKILNGVKILCKECHQKSKFITWIDFNRINEFSPQQLTCDTCNGIQIQDIE